MPVLAERQIRSGHLSAPTAWCSGLQRGITIAQLQLEPPVSRVLELGSGPGFLACHLLKALPNVHMVLLDFSAVMHELAKQRLGPLVSRVEFVEGSFKDRACELSGHRSVGAYSMSDYSYGEILPKRTFAKVAGA